MPNFKTPERFWSKVDVGDVTECWKWQAGKIGGGYGKFTIHHRQRQAHRVAWVLTYGPIPEGLCVLHKCDNPGCCNPYHLFLGTHADNMADALHKGRLARKLTEEDVLDIRELYATGEWTYGELADEFNVRKSTISYVICRRS